MYVNKTLELIEIFIKFILLTKIDIDYCKFRILNAMRSKIHAICFHIKSSFNFQNNAQNKFDFIPIKKQTKTLVKK